ncbi:MAG: potassium-transporting ATPase subunit KdpA [Parachlamydiales bacterium]|nr:potassium-transporting ATPase subunit KdpA [Parachlamydiales bacterium]
MIFQKILEIFLFFTLLTVFSFFLSSYMQKVFEERKTFLDFFLKPLEKFTYKICKIDVDISQNWKQYLKSIFVFTLICFIFTFLVIQFQRFLPFNPQKLKAPSLDTTFNIVVSYITNTNWQSYRPETTLSYFSQMVALTFQNFVSPAVGFCTALAFIRGFQNNASEKLGNFYKDLVKIILYVLLPLSIFASIIFAQQGVPQNFNSYKKIRTLEGKEQVIIGGPIASQEAIKILGTNGGGFTLANSAHPFENPTPVTNYLQILFILLIPAAQFFFFGKIIKNKSHAWSIYIAMVLFFLLSFWLCYNFDKSQSPVYKNNLIEETFGNLEGKETRFSEFNSALYVTATTTASNGATNCSHDSLMPISGLMPMLNIQLGEIVFGGIGSGLFSMIIYILLSIFICGLIIGKTPEYLGKKIEGKEVKLIVLSLIIFFFMILVFSAISSVSSLGLKGIKNLGPHGLTEILYAYSSAVGNNGSAFAGLKSDLMWYNISTAICMLVGRFEFIIFVLALAGSFAKKKKVVDTAAFPISGSIFSIVLFGTIILIGSLTFFPAVVMGPVLEKFYLIKQVFF